MPDRIITPEDIFVVVGRSAGIGEIRIINYENPFLYKEAEALRKQILDNIVKVPKLEAGIKQLKKTCLEYHNAECDLVIENQELKEKLETERQRKIGHIEENVYLKEKLAKVKECFMDHACVTDFDEPCSKCVLTPEIKKILGDTKE